MKKFLCLFFCLIFIGCTSKTIIVDKNGNQETQLKTNDAAYSEAQAKAWLEYYKALSSPPIIATLKDSCGGTIDIKSQLQPPLPYIGQYKNQYIKPITDVVKLGIKVIGGGIIAKEVIGALDGVTINNNGSGNVAVDSKDISQTGNIKEDLTYDSGDKEVNINVNNDDNSFTDSSVDNSNHEVTTNDVDIANDVDKSNYIDHSINSVVDNNDNTVINNNDNSSDNSVINNSDHSSYNTDHSSYNTVINNNDNSSVIDNNENNSYNENNYYEDNSDNSINMTDSNDGELIQGDL